MNAVINTPSPAPKATLVGVTSPLWGSAAFGHTLGPQQVIAIIWEQSKTTKPLAQIIDEVRDMSREELDRLLVAVMEGVPVVEAVSFQFILENVSISWREQMVRHRVGTKPDPRVGVDWQLLDIQELGDVADMSAWSQSMRLLDMSTFADEQRYRTPESVVALGENAVRDWHADMKSIQDIYEYWAKDKKIPLEDARDAIPLGATSRLSWSVNLRTLQHICAKRGCTILQLGLWGPVIKAMVTELTTKVSPAFGVLVTPPCMKGNKYTGCIFPEDNARRFDGRDPNLPVCSLYITNEETEHGSVVRKAWGRRNVDGVEFPNEKMVMAEAGRRETFWGRNPWTGQAK
jgi:hypothetical protein